MRLQPFLTVSIDLSVAQLIQIQTVGLTAQLLLEQSLSLDYLVLRERLRKNLEQRISETFGVVLVLGQQLDQLLVVPVSRQCVLFPPAPDARGTVGTADVKIARLLGQPRITTNGVVIMTHPTNISDDELKAAIAVNRPCTYLADLKRKVAESFNRPELATDSDFGYRVYNLDRAIAEEETASRLTAMGFELASLETLTKLENQAVEMLFGLGGIFGERIESGTIRSNGRGGFLFLPKGNRRRGFVPGYIRKVVPAKAKRPANRSLPTSDPNQICWINVIGDPPDLLLRVRPGR